MARRPHFIAAGLLFGLFFAYAGVNGYFHAQDDPPLGEQRLPRDPARRLHRGRLRQARRAGMGVVAVGDQLLALDGIGLRSALDVRDTFRSRPPGAYRALVRREGRLHELRLQIVPFGLGWATLLTVTPPFVSLLFLLFGSALLLLKPDDDRSWLLALMCSLMIFGDFTYSLRGIPVLIKAVLLVVPPVASLFWPVFLHFFLTFPEPGPLARRIPRLTRLVYLPGMLLLVPTAIGYYLYGRDQTLAWGFARSVPRWGEWLVRTLPILYVVGGLAALIVNYKHASRPARRKLRVVVAGTLVGFGPLLCLAIWGYFTEYRRFSELLISLWLASFLALLLIPLSFAYAIVRHQVIPIRLIVRQGIRYLLVAKGFFVVEALVLLAALGFLLTVGRAAFLDRLGELEPGAGAVLLPGATRDRDRRADPPDRDEGQPARDAVAGPAPGRPPLRPAGQPPARGGRLAARLRDRELAAGA